MHFNSTAISRPIETNEKPLDDSKKQELLASLSALDEKEWIKNEYEPSFLTSQNSSAVASRHSRRESEFNFGSFEDNPFNNAAFKSLDSSANSIKSVVSVNSEKKAKLMKELFS